MCNMLYCNVNGFPSSMVDVKLSLQIYIESNLKPFLTFTVHSFAKRESVRLTELTFTVTYTFRLSLLNNSICIG